MRTENTFNRSELALLFTGVGVEVGTERGVFAKQILKTARRLYCVDPWKAYKGYRDHVSQQKLDSFYRETQERLKEYDCTLMRMFSEEAVKSFPDGSLDFVYIDANHDYENVKRDIELWSKKVKEGGIVAGHDYVKRKGQGHLYGVVQAVDELGEDLTIWRGDKSPSWSFIKR